jgi:hypothetical protein
MIFIEMKIFHSVLFITKVTTSLHGRKCKEKRSVFVQSSPDIQDRPDRLQAEPFMVGSFHLLYCYRISTMVSQHFCHVICSSSEMHKLIGICDTGL